MSDWLPWILLALSLGLLIAAAGVAWRRRRQQARMALPADWPLTARPVFSAEERRVYRQLREAFPHHVVLAKLPLIRFCQADDPDQVRHWFRLLGNAQVAFAVCSASGRVLVALDIDVERGGARRALQIKQSVLAACRIRYLRCSAEHLPSIPELQLLVPQSAQQARGPLPAPTESRRLDPLHEVVRRRERVNLWQDSSLFGDSFFAQDSRYDSVPQSDFGGLRGAMMRDLQSRDSGPGPLTPVPPPAQRH
jgi:hypothetical protein